MIYDNTLNEISNNINTGVEYEIALFYQLLFKKEHEQLKVKSALQLRRDADKIASIISDTDITPIVKELNRRGFELIDASFETQNDYIGPADIVIYAQDDKRIQNRIGLSVKYANTCTLNVSGRNFITDAQIFRLREQLPQYTHKYINEMTEHFGSVDNWFRKRKPSITTEEYIDLIRDEVIANWSNINNKEVLLSTLFHANSPIEFWVVTYKNHGYDLKTTPQTIDIRRANDVTIGKFQTSYVAFYLDNRKVAHMQVKFNNVYYPDFG